MARRPIIGALIDRFKQRRPVVGGIVDALTAGLETAADDPETGLRPADVPRVVATVREAIAENPVARSQTSNEPWWQNRVKVGLYVVGLGAVLSLIDAGAASWWNQNQDTITTITVIFGGGIAAIGEWAAAWLAGIDWKRPWTILGIGR